MEDIKQEDIIETSPTSEEATAEETVETPTQDPLKTELDNVRKNGRTEAEKAAFSLRRNADRARELGVDPAKILGFEPEVATDDDDQPITRGELKKIISAQGAKTALQLAEEISDSSERELVKYNLENVIIASGNAQEDLKAARRIVNSIRNEQIAQEAARKSQPKTHSSSSSAPAKEVAAQQELTADEMAFMKPPFNLTREQIIKARKG